VNGFDHPKLEPSTATTLPTGSDNIDIITTPAPISSINNQQTADDTPIVVTTATTTTLLSTSGASSITSSSSILPTEAETAVQAVRNHVESLKYPGEKTDIDYSKFVFNTVVGSPSGQNRRKSTVGMYF